jgi:hypothetical protein
VQAGKTTAYRSRKTHVMYFCEEPNAYVHILSALNLVDVTPAFGTVSMFVVVDITNSTSHIMCRYV